MEALLLFGLLVVFIIVGMPIGIAIGASTAVAMVVSGVPLISISLKSYAGVDSFSFLAMPFFILAGAFMSTGGIARRLVNFANTCIGFITGGLAITTTLACMFFAAISGSALATTSAIGSIMIPEMEKKGYDKSFSSALAASAGTIGIIIPPSIPFVVYAVAANVSVGDMFLAGIIPGVLFGIALIVCSYIISKKNNYSGSGVRPTVKSVLVSFKDSFLSLLAPVIVLGGIYTGFFTPTEAAVVAVVYSFILGAFVYKEIKWKDIYNGGIDTVVLNGAISYMIALSIAFAYYLSVQQIPKIITEFMSSVTGNEIVLLLVINVLLLLIGCVIDWVPAVIVLTPILLPLVQSYGMSSVTFGVLMIANLAIGFVTPPFGPNLFVAAAVGGVSFDSMIKHAIKFIIAMIIALMFVTFCPPVTTLLLG